MSRRHLMSPRRQVTAAALGLLAAIISRQPVAAEVFLDMPTNSGVVSLGGLGLTATGQQTRSSINGVEITESGFQSSIPYDAIAEVIEARLFTWIDTELAARASGTLKEVELHPFRLDLPNMIAIGIVSVPGKSQSEVPANSGQGGSMVVKVMKVDKGEATEVVVSNLAGPVSAVMRRTGLAQLEPFAIDGEQPIVELRHTDRPGNPATIVFEGRWTLESRAAARLRSLKEEEFAIVSVDRGADGIAISAIGSNSRFESFLSPDDSGINTEVVSIFNR